MKTPLKVSSPVSKHDVKRHVQEAIAKLRGLDFTKGQIMLILGSIALAIVAYIYFADFRRPHIKKYEEVYKNADDIAKVDLLAGQVSQSFQPLEQQLDGKYPEEITTPQPGSKNEHVFDDAVKAQQEVLNNVKKDKEQTLARGGVATLDQLEQYHQPQAATDPVLAQNIQQRIDTAKGHTNNNYGNTAMLSGVNEDTNKLVKNDTAGAAKAK